LILAMGWAITIPGLGMSDEMIVTPDVLQPVAENPLLVRGRPGEFDAVKVGPRVVLKEGPTIYKMWYEGVPGANRASVGYATSSDGLTWRKFSGNPVMTPSEPWEGGPNGEISPNMVLKEDDLYKMWYHSWDGFHRRIGYATSKDGLRWNKYPGNPVLDVGQPGTWDASQLAGPTVIKMGGVYYMWYMGLSEKDDGWRIGLATSADGIHLSKYPGNPVFKPGPRGTWEEWGVGTGGIIWDGTYFHLWYSGFNRNISPGVGYASSRDGIHWRRSQKNPILAKSAATVPECREAGDSVTAYQDSDGYRILYGGWDGKRWSICMALSRLTGGSSSQSLRPQPGSED
jgi:predicted GH43/DUF377 family glycosyl hydrolase